ncbi:MAG: HlyD family efflux transporter periplasmic adaptor subunit [Planctomycetes bacterium]|jgi:HlyD family secretion protein|nr:HlyD family efflux transporter periplasmic adaptor subunit [Planctomycetota bacterium]
MIQHRTYPDARRRGFAAGKILAVVIAVPVVLVGVGFLAFGGGDDTAETTTAAATTGDWYAVRPISFDLTITANGELEARDKVEIKSRVHGRPAIIEIVEEGSFVREGDLLFRLESDETAKELEQARLDTERARADKIAAEQELEIQINEADSARKAAEVKLSLAQLDLQKWKKGDVVTRRNELQLALEKAKRRVERAKRDYELSQELYDQQFISLNELEDAEIEQIEATDALATAKLNIEVYEKYEFLKDKQQFESDVEQAEAELERTINKNQSTLARHRSDLESKKQQLSIREQRLQELEEQLASTEVRAPQAGLVVYASSVERGWRRNDPISEGRQVRFGETVILLPDTRQMAANLRVHEALIGQVQIGQRVALVIDAMRGRTIQGEVVNKAVTPEDGGWWNPNLREYEVRVELPEGIEGLKPAMRCQGQIFIGRVEDALAVPVQAVHTVGEKRFVYVPDGGGRVKPKPVTIGRASESLVEIEKGLDPGDRVLLRDPRPGESTETVESEPDTAPTA